MICLAADDIYFPYNAVILGNPAFFQCVHGLNGAVKIVFSGLGNGEIKRRERITGLEFKYTLARF